MAEPFIGQISMFGFNFAVRQWAMCSGQILPIAQNTALFSLLGTIYGGDGRTTYALPDMRGRVPMHYGNALGLTPRNIGEKGGVETVTLTEAEMPRHTHSVTTASQLNGFSAPGTTTNPVGHLISGSSTDTPYGSGTGLGALGEMDPRSITVETTLGHAGASQAHYNMQPYQVVNFQIALFGIYPSRS